jgi:hypothetical protein
MNQQAAEAGQQRLALPERADRLSAEVYELAGGEKYAIEVPVAGVRP